MKKPSHGTSWLSCAGAIALALVSTLVFTACVSPRAESTPEENALFVKAECGDFKAADLCGLNINLQRTPDERTLLICAVLSLNAESVSEILSLGADPNIPDAKSLTPLHYAAGVYSCDVMTLLLKHKAAVDSVTKDGRTPLMEAARLGNTDAVKQLLEAGAKLAVSDSKGRTPIMFAAEARSNSLEIVKLMLEKGADENAVDRNAFCAAAHAVDGTNTETALYLIDRMPELEKASRSSALAYIVMKRAIAKNDSTAVRKLIAKKLPLNSDISMVLKAMEVANMEGVYEFFARNSVIDDGRKPLFWAAEFDRLEIINILLESGADADAFDNSGNKAAAYANRYETVRALKKAMKKK